MEGMESLGRSGKTLEKPGFLRKVRGKRARRFESNKTDFKIPNTPPRAPIEQDVIPRSAEVAQTVEADDSSDDLGEIEKPENSRTYIGQVSLESLEEGSVWPPQLISALEETGLKLDKGRTTENKIIVNFPGNEHYEAEWSQKQALEFLREVLAFKQEDTTESIQKKSEQHRNEKESSIIDATNEGELEKSKDYIAHLDLGALNTKEEWPSELITALRWANIGAIFEHKKKKIGKATLVEQKAGKRTPEKIGEKELTQREAAGYLKRLWGVKNEVRGKVSTRPVPVVETPTENGTSNKPETAILQKKPEVAQVASSVAVNRVSGNNLFERLLPYEKHFIEKFDSSMLDNHAPWHDALLNAMKRVYGERNVKLDNEKEKKGTATVTREERRGGRRVISFPSQKEALNHLRQVLIPSTKEREDRKNPK